MADETLQDRFISVFRRKLEELPRKDKKLLSADAEDAVVHISTSEELTPQAQETLKEMLVDILDIENPKLTFTVNSHLLCGIEFSVNGNVVFWSLDDYLNSFTTKMQDALENIALRMGREEA